ncbi:lantibiotic dehydratase C-terminal domain-containing protein [Streptomyces sp. NPDC058612]|uniref:lantibiotic dehydratase C-terminal domain-containing protein n=1 Tax=Streptomyces sp. NPDC058612 TaxID=3346555 RepID=UPI00364EC782
MGRSGVSLYIYHWSDQGLPLSAAVSPLVPGLEEAGLLRGWFFQRSWRGGPHVRLRLLAAQPVQHGTVRRAVEGRLGAHLAAHPTAAPVAAPSYTASVAAYAHAYGLDASDRSLRLAGTEEVCQEPRLVRRRRGCHSRRTALHPVQQPGAVPARGDRLPAGPDERGAPGA